MKKIYLDLLKRIYLTKKLSISLNNFIMQRKCLFLGYKKNQTSLIRFLKKKNFTIKNYQKIPFSNTKGKKTIAIVRKLLKKGVKFNITAIFTLKQIVTVLKNVPKNSNIIISVFSGRIADTGINPAIIIKKAVHLASKYKNVKILWASTREIYNIFEANKLSCHIITVPTDIIKKFNLLGKNLDDYSIETIKDFYNDAKSTNYKI